MDVTTDDKFELIEAKYGIMGFGIVIKLYQKIYKNGYYLEWNEEKLLLFKKQVNVNSEDIENIINDCIRYNIFDENLYKKYNILTSTGIQKRYLKAIERRKSAEMNKNYVIVDINEFNVDINLIDDGIKYTKKSKVNESKEKENIYIPEWDEFCEYAISVKHDINKEIAKAKYTAWKLDNWKDGKGKKIRNWKSKVNHNVQYWGRDNKSTYDERAGW